MAEQVRLIAEDCAGARLLARQLESRLFEVEWFAPSQLLQDVSVAPGSTLQVLYGGGDAANLLIDFQSSVFAGDLPTLLVVANPDLQGAAFLSHAHVDECLCLPITEEGLSLRLRQLALHQRLVNGFLNQWPDGLAPKQEQLVEQQPLSIRLVEPDQLTAERCLRILKDAEHDVSAVNWEDLTASSSCDLLLANPGIGPETSNHLAWAREYLERNQGTTQFALIGDAGMARSSRAKLQGRAMAAGATAFLDKPFSDLYLSNTVQRLANRVHQISGLKSALSEIRKLGTNDGLTGLRSRGYAERVLSLVDGASLALLDLDNLKTINDVHGHGAGDAALRAVANALQASLSSAQIIARWGGDEFLVFDLNTDDLNASLIKCSQSMLPLQLEGDVDPAPVPRFSFGIAQTSEAADLDGLIALADKRLYQQKRAKKGALRPH